MRSKLKFPQQVLTWDWWTTQLTLLLRDDHSLEIKRSLRLTPLRVALVGFLFFITVFSFGFFLASQLFNTPLANQSEAQQKDQILTLRQQVDALQEKMDEDSAYIYNIKQLLLADQPYLKNAQPLAVSQDKTPDSLRKKVGIASIEHLEQADLKLREEIERSRRGFSFIGADSRNLRDLLLFPPLQGIISQSFLPADGHLGVDIVSEKGAPIKSVAEGTVIFSSWTDETGYVITIQHAGDLLSSYKHCSSLLKKAGSFVQAGEIIAIIGNTGELSTGPHLHLELWYRGNPINPEELITF